MANFFLKSALLQKTVETSPSVQFLIFLELYTVLDTFWNSRELLRTLGIFLELQKSLKNSKKLLSAPRIFLELKNAFLGLGGL